MPARDGGSPCDTGIAVQRGCYSRQMCHLLRSIMNMFDLIKATIACGLSAFLIYSFPVIGQVIIIGVLSLLWLAYAHKTFAHLLRR